MACQFLERSGSFFGGDATCGVTKKTINSYTVTNVCDTWSKHIECADYKKATSLCFITAAVCGSLGKPDDCEELTAMRRFRDEWLRAQPFGEKDTEDYYQDAPAICAAIDQAEDHADIYKMIFQKYILVCVTAFQAGDSLGCYRTYKSMVADLQEKYGLTPGNAD